MKKIMPQELDVWYLIPAIRRELAIIFTKEKKLSQKKVATILGLTESAISQYLKSKRAEELKFSAKDKEEIRKTADKMLTDESNSTKYLYELSIKLRSSGCLCNLHRKHDKDVSIYCDICGCKQ